MKDIIRSMKLEEAKEVKICYDEKSVNAALKDKYVLKKVVQTRGNGDSEILPTFILIK